VAEGVAVGGADALLERPVKDVDARVARRELVGDPPGPVRRAVVGDQEVTVDPGALELGEDRLDQRRDVLGLVVGGDADPDRSPRRGVGRQGAGAGGRGTADDATRPAARP